MIWLLTFSLFFISWDPPQQSADTASRFSRAVELQRQGALTEAVAEYRAVIAAAPGYAEAHANLGAILARLGKFDEAIASYESALKFNPKLTPILLNIGIAYFRAGQFEKARASLERFLAAVPATASAAGQGRLLLGLTLVELGRDAEAIDKLEPAVDDGVDDPAALYSLGLAYLRLKRDGSRETAQKLSAHPAGRAVYHLLLGQILLSETNHRAALIELQEASKLNSDLPQLHYALGLALLGVGERKEALAQFEEERRRRPQDFWTLYHLALVNEAEKNFAEARRRLDEALKLDPRSPEANGLLGKLLVKEGKVKDALAPLEIAVSEESAESETHYFLGRVYRSLGRTAEADREFAIAQKLKVRQVEVEKKEAVRRQ